MLDYFWHGIVGRPYKLHVQHRGDSSKPVVVLLHGIAASGEDWRKVIAYLETDYHCITIDLLGFGKSPKPQWSHYRMDDHMRSLFHTMNKLRLGKQFTLVGHSLGSLLAVRYATEHERNICRLLLLSPPVYPPLGAIKSRTARQLTGLLLKIYKYLHSSPRMTPELFRKLTYIAPLPRSIVKDPLTWVPFMHTLSQCIEQQTVLRDIRKLSLPIDVCYGSLDQVVINSNVEMLARHANVRLHPFLNTHDLTDRYGKLVAEILSTSSV